MSATIITYGPSHPAPEYSSEDEKEFDSKTLRSGNDVDWNKNTPIHLKAAMEVLRDAAPVDVAEVDDTSKNIDHSQVDTDNGKPISTTDGLAVDDKNVNEVQRDTGAGDSNATAVDAAVTTATKRKNKKRSHDDVDDKNSGSTLRSGRTVVPPSPKKRMRSGRAKSPAKPVSASAPGPSFFASGSASVPAPANTQASASTSDSHPVPRADAQKDEILEYLRGEKFVEQDTLVKKPKINKAGVVRMEDPLIPAIIIKCTACNNVLFDGKEKAARKKFLRAAKWVEHKEECEYILAA